MHTAFSHPKELNFLWRISLVRGVILLLRFDAFNWFAAQEAVTQSIFVFFCFVYLGFFNGKAERSKGYGVRGGRLV